MQRFKGSCKVKNCSKKAFHREQLAQQRATQDGGESRANLGATDIGMNGAILLMSIA